MFVRRAPLTPERAGEAAARLAAVAEGRAPHVADHPVLRRYATAKLRELLEETGGLLAESHRMVDGVCLGCSASPPRLRDAEGEALAPWRS